MPKYMMNKEGEVVEIPFDVQEIAPEPIERVERVEAQPEPEDKDGLADMFEVPKTEDNDMDTEYLFETDKEDDLSDMTEIPSDLTDVSREDIMGEEAQIDHELQDFPDDLVAGMPSSQEDSQTKRYRPSRIRRLKVLRREPPPTSMGGVRY